MARYSFNRKLILSLLSFIMLTVNFVNAQTTPPKVQQLIFDSNVYTFEGIVYLEARSFIAKWQIPVGYTAGASNLAYKLFLKKDGGEWMPIMKSSSDPYYPSTTTQYSSATWPLGRYQFRVQACDFSLSNPCGAFTDTTEVKLIDPVPTPSLSEIKITGGVRTENSELINDSRSIKFQWSPPSPYTVGNSRMKYKLFWQKEGQMQPSKILNSAGGEYFESTVTEYIKTEIPNGQYSLHVSPCYFTGRSNGDYGCVISTKSATVKVIDKPAPPAKPKNFYTSGLKSEPDFWVVDGAYGEAITFGSMVNHWQSYEYFTNQVTFKIYHRNLGDSNWLLFTNTAVDNPPKAYYGRHLEKKEFAAEACNNIGCSEKAILSKPVLFRLPEITNSTYMAKHLSVINVKGSSSNGNNFCRTSKETGKCEYEYTEVRTEAKGVTAGFNPFCLVYAGTAVSCNAEGKFNYRISNLAEGVHTFEIRAPGATGSVVERIHFTVFKPVEGYLTSDVCMINASQETCPAQINGVVSGDYPVCILSQAGIQLACAASGNATLNTTVDLSVEEREFSLVAKEPGGDRVLQTLKLKSRFMGVSFDVSASECSIIKPSVSCIQPIKWSVSSEYTNTCLFIDRSLYRCGIDLEFDYSFSVGAHALELREGIDLNDKLLFSTTYKARYAPSGSFAIQAGGQNPCVPFSGATNCKIPVHIEHWNVGLGGAVLYKNNQAWANLGLSSNGTPYRGAYELDAEEGGTHWSLKVEIDGVLKEFASIDLYPTTFKSSGYDLSVDNEVCEFNPLYESSCQVRLDWVIPTLGGCVFEKGVEQSLYCPPSLTGSGNPNLASGTHIYQLRTGVDLSSPLVAQVAAIAQEKQVANISVIRKKCIDINCDIALDIFTNFEGNVCLYDNGVKVDSYCGIHRKLLIGSYILKDSLHKLELVLQGENNNNIVVASREVHGVQRASSSSSNLSSSANSSVSQSIKPFAKFNFAEGENGSCSLKVGFEECEVLVDIEHRNVSTGGIVLYKNEIPWANLGLSSEGTPYIDRYALTASRQGTHWSLRMEIDGVIEEIAAINLFSLATNEFLVDEPLIVELKNTSQLNGIKKILFYLESQLIAEDHSYPYELQWTPNSSGFFMIKVVAELQDSSQQVIQWLGIQVADFPSKSYAHNLVLQSPLPDKVTRKILGAEVLLQATVYDQALRRWKNTDGSVPIIDFFVDDVLVSNRENISAQVFSWVPTKVGMYRIKAVAHLDDNEKIESMEATIIVDRPRPPTIAVQTNGSGNLGVAIELSAVVTDPDQQIEQVTFYANGEPVGKLSNQPPYSTRWTPVVPGNYELTAKLLDKRGNEIVSAVKNALVQPTIFSLDGLDILSEFGTPTVSQGWSVMPLKVSDVLTLNPANNYRISYNKLDKLVLNRPLKIINRSDAYDNEIVPQLIVLDADQVELKSGIEIIGEPADLLIINTSTSNVIRCENCGFTNVQRAVLAVATPATALSSSMAQVGELQTRAAGVVDINNLQASGVVSLEMIADKVIAKGHISTQQHARQSTEVNSQTGVNEQVLDFVAVPDINSVVVGSGGVSLLHGNLRVNYETMTLENTVAGTGVMDLQAAISSGAINIFATDAIQLSGNLSTHSSHRAAQIYRGQLRAQEEQIQLKTIVQAGTAPSVRINGSVLSDAKVHMIGHSAEIAVTGGVQAHSVKAELIGQLMNRGYIRGYARATTTNAANGDAMIELGAGSLDNRGEIRGVFNNLVVAGGSTSIEGKINIASEGDVYNRFGGSITAKTIKVYAKGKIRNGSLFAFDATASGGKESTTAITLAPHDTEVLSTHKVLSFSLSEPPLKNTKASIVGEEVTLQAKQSVENINPYTEPYTSAAVEISTLSDNAEIHANDVQIEATRKLQIFSDTYLLNSSARMGVSQAGANNLFSIKVPIIRNERYYNNIITEGFNDSEVVKSQTNTTITTWVNGVQSRYGFYSPPGYIYSFAEAQLDFGSNGNGLLNNISFVDLYGDLKVFGQGKITTRGISLEKMAYDAGTTTVVSIEECRAAQSQGQHNAYRVCTPRTVFNSTPDGKLLKQSPDNTLFAVNGQISASASVFNARNDQSLTVLRKKVIAEYINEQTLIAEQQHAYDISSGYMDSACIQSVSFEEKDNVLLGTRRQFSENPQVRCFHRMAFAGQNQYGQSVYSAPYNWTTSFGYKNITDLVNEKRPEMNAALNKQINDYNAWRAVAK